jgi:hypothetical protein
MFPCCRQHRPVHGFFGHPFPDCVSQPLFDVVTTVPLLELAQHNAVVPAKVFFGETPFAKDGMTLRNTADADGTAVPTTLTDVPGRLLPDSPFPFGMYATERVFSEGCRGAFLGFVEGLLQDSAEPAVGRASMAED